MAPSINECVELFKSIRQQLNHAETATMDQYTFDSMGARANLKIEDMQTLAGALGMYFGKAEDKPYQIVFKLGQPKPPIAWIPAGTPYIVNDYNPKFWENWG